MARVDPVPIMLGEMAARALSGSGDLVPGNVDRLAERAVRFYFADRQRDEHPGWAYPSFVSAGPSGEATHETHLSKAVCDELEREAERQNVPQADLLQHAVFYYAAARDQGRLTQQILEELRREEVEAAGDS